MSNTPILQMRELIWPAQGHRTGQRQSQNQTQVSWLFCYVNILPHNAADPVLKFKHSAVTL